MDSSGAGDQHPFQLVAGQGRRLDLLAGPTSGGLNPAQTRAAPDHLTQSLRSVTGNPNSTSAPEIIACHCCRCSEVRVNEPSPRWSQG
jgi:hypothetical protein